MALLSKSYNLRKINPKLSREWHPTKNGTLTPKDVAPYAKKKVWWICEKRHEWQAVIGNRQYGRGCPYCNSKKICNDNCLATKNRNLAREWHPIKNGILTPNNVLPGCNIKVWWMCKEGHEWQTTINHRNRGTNCPYCSNNKVSEKNSLEKNYPELIEKWHPSRNGKLTPGDVLPGSLRKVWWICKKGHEWQTAIANLKRKSGCPYCNNRKVCNDNCLATKNRNLAREWHPVRNGKLTPKDVVPGSGKKVWWRCRKGHQWQAIIQDRNTGKSCPYCSNQKVCNDNCLATLNKALAKEWHPAKNGTLTPKDVIPGSSQSAWWICEKGHEWQAIIFSRNKGNGCPYCSNKKVCKDNCLATLNRNLTLEWHPTANHPLTPEDVVANSLKKVWWICRLGHQWKAAIYNRNSYYIKNQKGTGCPYCAHLNRRTKKRLKNRKY